MSQTDAWGRNGAGWCKCVDADLPSTNNLEDAIAASGRKPKSVESLITASHQSWLKYRDANCAAQRYSYSGTGAGLAYFDCLYRISFRRLVDLQSIDVSPELGNKP